jgi:CheY-like chemotaxis protein
VQDALLSRVHQETVIEPIGLQAALYCCSILNIVFVYIRLSLVLFIAGLINSMNQATVRIKSVVALFNASDDTVEMVQRMLDASDFSCLVGCHFADLKKGRIDFGRYLAQYSPEVVIVDVSPPYAENWQFLKTLLHDKAMIGRGIVVTTTNKMRLDETVGCDSEALEIVGKPYDLDQIKAAIHAALKRARQPR